MKTVATTFVLSVIVTMGSTNALGSEIKFGSVGNPSLESVEFTLNYQCRKHSQKTIGFDGQTHITYQYNCKNSRPTEPAIERALKDQGAAFVITKKQTSGFDFKLSGGIEYARKSDPETKTFTENWTAFYIPK